MRVLVHAVEYVDVAWKKILVAFGIFENQQIALVLDDYRSSILFQTDLDLEDIRNLMDQKAMISLDIEDRVPLVGFTADRKDRIVRLSLQNERQRYSVLQKLRGKGAILHEMIRPEVCFLHETHLHLMSFWDVHGTLSTDKMFSCPAYRCQFGTIRETTQLLPDVFKVCFFRIAAKSLSSTSLNQFTPVSSTDPIRLICVQLGTSSPVVLQDKEEHRVLTQFFAFVQHAHLYVYCGDRFNDLAYVIHRADILGVSSHALSFVRDRACKLVHKDTKLLDVTMHGKHRLNIAAVLPKLMISPPMNGYTLADIVDHPKLLKRRHLDWELPTVDSDISALTRDLLLSLAVIADTYTDNSLFLQFASISNTCDLSLSLCVERGQQARIRNIFFRSYYENGLYFNHTQLEVPFITVQKARADSSFPDPPWLRNPTMASLTVQEEEQQQAKKPRTAWHAMQHRRAETNAALKENNRAETTKGFQGGFVIEPEPGFYVEPAHAVCTLDFASLYPSIIKGYRICYKRVVYNAAYLHDPDVELDYVPMTDTVCAVFIKSYKNAATTTITDTIIHNVMQMRKNVRMEMKTLGADSFEYAVLDARQLGCKVIQNACYGFLGSRTSGMLCTALAAAVTNLGANMNKRVRHLVLSEGGRAVYGDTDSVMVQFPTVGKKTKDEILTHIYACAHSIAQRSKTMFPPPNMVEFECVKLPFLMLNKKKTYAAVQYPPHTWKNVEPEQVTKGMSFKKRDRCALVQETVRTIRDMIMSMSSEDAIVQYVRDALARFSKRPQSIEEVRPFVVTCRLAETYKNENVLAPHLAKQMEAASGQKPMQGSRLVYVIVEGAEPHYTRARVPALGVRLDIAWYIETQFMKSVAQLLSIAVHANLLKRLQAYACAAIRTHRHADLAKLL
jgi:DNA polymerase elongation subunit (family B)